MSSFAIKCGPSGWRCLRRRIRRVYNQGAIGTFSIYTFRHLLENGADMDLPGVSRSQYQYQYLKGFIFILQNDFYTGKCLPNQYKFLNLKIEGSDCVGLTWAL